MIFRAAFIVCMFYVVAAHAFVPTPIILLHRAVGMPAPAQQMISSISPARCSIATGATGTCATMTVMISPPSPPFSGNLTLINSNAACPGTNDTSDFAMSGFNLNLTNASIATGSYDACVAATQTGVMTVYQQVAITVTSSISADFVANVGTTYNTIDGFGAAGAFTDPPNLTNAQMDQLYCMTSFTSPCAQSGIGLEFYRGSCCGDTNEIGDYQNAFARGAKIYMTTWSIATDPSTYSSSISTINNWISTLNSDGVTSIYATTTQNEPDCGCNSGVVWTPSQTVNFIDSFGPNLSSSILLASPEAAGTNVFGSFVSAIEGDATANSYVKIFSYHQYSGTTAEGGWTNDHTRHVWETEMFDQTTGGDNTIDEAVGTGGISQLIWDSIVNSGENAWFYWWIDDRVTSDTSNAGLWYNGGMSKRVPAFGNWSLFVRPGWKRVNVTGSVSGIYGVTAFVSPTGPSGGFAIIAINDSGSTISNVTFGISGPTINGTVAPWVTSGTAIGNIGTDGNLSLGSTSSSIPTSLTPSGNVVTVSIPYGVVTLVGQTN